MAASRASCRRRPTTLSALADTALQADWQGTQRRLGICARAGRGCENRYGLSQRGVRIDAAPAKLARERSCVVTAKAAGVGKRRSAAEVTPAVRRLIALAGARRSILSPSHWTSLAFSAEGRRSAGRGRCSRLYGAREANRAPHNPPARAIAPATGAAARRAGQRQGRYGANTRRQQEASPESYGVTK